LQKTPIETIPFTPCKMNESSLKKKTAIAIAWNSFEKIGSQLVFFAIGIYVARLLTPGDYGLIGMLGIFSAISLVLVDSGFSSALVRKTDADESDYNTVFYFNLGVSSLIYLLLYIFAPAISDFFNEPRLTLLSRVLFSGIIINSLGIIQSTLLTKKLQFRKTSIVNVGSLLLSGILAVILVRKGFGVWTLVWQMLSASAFKVTLLWFFGNWHPRFLFSLQSLKEQMKYSAEMTIAGILGTTSQYVYSLIIGKNFTSESLGNFTQASKMSDMPITTLSGTIYSAMFPTYSQIKDDAERLKRAFQKTIRFTAFVAFPILFGLILIGPNLFEILLTKKWEGSFLYFQLLCLAGIPTIFTTVIQNFIRINQRVTLFVYFEIAKIGFLAIAILSAIKFGITALVVSLVAVRFLVYLMNLYYIGKKVNYHWHEQLRDMLPYFTIGLGMVIVSYPLCYIIENSSLLIIAQTAAGAIFYIGISKYLKSKVLDDLIAMVFKK